VSTIQSVLSWCQSDAGTTILVLLGCTVLLLSAVFGIWCVFFGRGAVKVEKPPVTPSWKIVVVNPGRCYTEYTVGGEVMPKKAAKRLSREFLEAAAIEAETPIATPDKLSQDEAREFMGLFRIFRDSGSLGPVDRMRFRELNAKRIRGER